MIGSSWPWWMKMSLKMGIGMLPITYEQLRSWFTGSHGVMEQMTYARQIFNSYIEDYQRHLGPTCKGTLLELGPGGSLLNGLMALQLGFERVYLVDVGDFASKDPDVYAPALALLNPEQQQQFEQHYAQNQQLLQAFQCIGIHYLTKGLASLKSMDSQCVDFCFSNAVIEHIHAPEFDHTIDQLARIHKPQSVSAHEIDYKDHLGGGLNNLRFATASWESRWFANQGFYTNRLRHRQVCQSFERAGFQVIDDRPRTWDKLPLPNERMAEEFRQLQEADLIIRESRTVFRKID